MKFRNYYKKYYTVKKKSLNNNKNNKKTETPNIYHNHLIFNYSLSSIFQSYVNVSMLCGFSDIKLIKYYC